MRTRTPGLSAVVLAVAGLLLATALPAQAARTDAAVTLGTATTLTVTGHGWGHGHGMSQYGAQGAAKQGLTYKQIIDFYYPSTSWSQVTGKVRVLISADTTSDVVVAAMPGLRLTDIGAGKTYTLPSPRGVKRWRVAVGTGNKSVVDYLTGS